MSTSVRQENRWRRTLKEQNDAVTDRRREVEATFMVRGPRPKPVPPPPNATRRQVRSWMWIHAEEYETATHLAEAANTVFDLPGTGLDDETHWIWDEAFAAKEGDA